jgi:hypothetical protein
LTSLYTGCGTIGHSYAWVAAPGSCGSASISIEELKKQTTFTGGGPDEEVNCRIQRVNCRIQRVNRHTLARRQARFWAAMEQMTEAERSMVLKFASGRIRLPVSFKISWSAAGLGRSAVLYHR